MQDRYSSPEWNADDWHEAWRIGVGTAYRCAECGNMIIVVRGGTGTLAPRCHGQPMKPVEARR